MATKTLKISTASVQSALRKAEISVADDGMYSASGARVQTVNSAWANDKIQKVSFVTWHVRTLNRYRPWTDEERAAHKAQVDAGLASVIEALTTAGYIATRRDTQYPEVAVTLP